MSRTTSKTICFTSGHGELSLEDEGENPRSASFLKQGLAADGLNVRALDNSAASIPSDCNILMVAGPEQAFTPVEATAVDMYLTQGGKAIFLLDPNITSAQLSKAPLTIKDSGLESVLIKWGANVGKNVVLEKQMQLFAGVQISPTIRAQKYGDQPITEPLKKGKQTVFDRVRSVQKSASFAGTAVELVFSGGNGGSWAQADIDAAFRQQTVKPSSGDIQGPVSLALYAEKESDIEGKKLKTQIVVVGDSDFASNAMIRGNEFNFDLVLNSVTYLGGENEQISIRPKAIRASAIELSPEQANTIFYVAIISLPMLVLTFGLNLWWYRKQKA